MKITTYEQIQVDKSAVALGKFQGLHKGHMLLLNKIVSFKKSGLTSVAFTINMPDKKLLYLPDERYMILNKLGIDIAVECNFSESFASMSASDFVKEILVNRLHAAYVVVGEDFRFGYNREGTVDRLTEYGLKYGFRVIAFEKLCLNENVISSSLLRSLIDKGEMKLIHELLGRDYSITGIVEHGKKLGRTIGFPTVNIYPDKKKLLPPAGVYESELEIDGIWYKGVTNIGDNPTTDGDGKTRVETYIVDYSGDMYGRTITVYIKSFIRTEKKFNNIEELRYQIDIDKKSVMHQ